MKWTREITGETSQAPGVIVGVFRLFVLVLLAASLAGCFTPSSGPAKSSFYPENQDAGNQPGFEVVELDDGVLDLLKHRAHDSFSGHFDTRQAAPATVRVGVGDVVGVSIFESSGGGLFTPLATDSLRQGNYVALPQQLVDKDGTISVPYAGQVYAAGKTRHQVEAEILSRLKERAIEPQVVISIVESRSSLYSVLGEVHAPGRFAINWTGERLLAGIARAGGPKWPDFETSVTLTRHGQNARVMLQTVVQNPKEDIYLRPGDSVFLRHEPRFYTALGAAGKSGQYPIDVPRLTLAEGVGRAQGLLDTQADPTGVFLLRWEHPAILSRLQRDVTKYASGRVPTVYHLDWHNPRHLLASQQIDLLDKDLVYVTNAESVEVLKVLQVMGSASGIGANVGITRFYFAN